MKELTNRIAAGLILAGIVGGAIIGLNSGPIYSVGGAVMGFFAGSLSAIFVQFVLYIISSALGIEWDRSISRNDRSAKSSNENPGELT
jgi:hypothetical protein